MITILNKLTDSKYFFLGDSNRPAMFEDLKKLDYLEMALKVRKCF